jgi:hypothetical protein
MGFWGSDEPDFSEYPEDWNAWDDEDKAEWYEERSQRDEDDESDTRCPF